MRHLARHTAWLTGLALVAAVTWVSGESRADDHQPIEGIGPTGDVQRLATGLGFTEGPTRGPDGSIYFTDIPNNKIYRLDQEGNLAVWVDGSNHANGLMYDGRTNRIVACEMDGRVVSYDMEGGDRKVLAAEYQGKRFNAPNDLVLDQHGGIYFTDPTFRAPDPNPQDKMGVYYVAADGKISRLIDDLPLPNGVILSPDEKTLYVIPTGQADMMAYPVTGPGKLGEGRVFCRLVQPDESRETNFGGDGLTVDTQGNLYITAPRVGLQVFNPEGKLLGIIKLPEGPANVTFGGPENSTLYVTARTSLYAVPTSAKGHHFAQSKE